MVVQRRTAESLLQRRTTDHAQRPSPIQCVSSGPVVQLRRYEGEQLEKLNAIARAMGVDPDEVEFHVAEGSESNSALGNKITIKESLFSSQKQLEFTVAHELSHYKTFDTRFPVNGIPFGSVLGGLVAAGGLGTLFGGAISAPLLGLLGGAVEYSKGGGVMNSLITGSSLLGATGLGPLGMWLGGTLGGALLGPVGASIGTAAGGLFGGILGAAASFPIVNKLFELKSDLHAASVVGAEGGVSRFEEEQQEAESQANSGEIFAGVDPTHPSLPLRLAYLKLLLKNKQD